MYIVHWVFFFFVFLSVAMDSLGLLLLFIETAGKIMLDGV